MSKFFLQYFTELAIFFCGNLVGAPLYIHTNICVYIRLDVIPARINMCITSLFHIMWSDAYFQIMAAAWWISNRCILRASVHQTTVLYIKINIYMFGGVAILKTRTHRPSVAERYNIISAHQCRVRRNAISFCDYTFRPDYMWKSKWNWALFI